MEPGCHLSWKYRNVILRAAKDRCKSAPPQAYRGGVFATASRFSSPPWMDAVQRFRKRPNSDGAVFSRFHEPVEDGVDRGLVAATVHAKEPHKVGVDTSWIAVSLFSRSS